MVHVVRGVQPVAPGKGINVLAGQCLQMVLPSPGAYLPVTQGAQRDPEIDAAVPGRHGEQLTALIAMKCLPAGQKAQTRSVLKVGRVTT